MGIYSIPTTTTNEVTKYVQESFLESCIDESALSILDEINNIGTKSITEAFESMVDVSNKIENSSLNKDTKQLLRYSLIENVYCNFSKGTMINDEFLSESTIDSILEFDGNAEKNK